MLDEHTAGHRARDLEAVLGAVGSSPVLAAGT
jgi:hypothetical protein